MSQFRRTWIFPAAGNDEDAPVIYVVHNWVALPLTGADQAIPINDE